MTVTARIVGMNMSDAGRKCIKHPDRCGFHVDAGETVLTATMPENKHNFFVFKN